MSGCCSAMVGGIFGWVYGMSSAAGCVSGGVCAEFSAIDVAGTNGSGACGSVGVLGLGVVVVMVMVNGRV